MKKQIFYTMIYHHGAPGAVRVDGYTDGTYNYYKNKHGRWHAIEPVTGLDIGGMQPTRKAAQERAQALQERVIETLKATGATHAARLKKLIPGAIDYAQL